MISRTAEVMRIGPVWTGEALDPDINGRVVCAHTKVAIIGCGVSRDLAPWGDPSWCFWALNEIYQPRLDRHFELHPQDAQSDEDLRWLAKCQTPCYVLDPGEWHGAVPYPVRYPLERVLDVTRGRRYFTCTFAYQVALAVADGVREIGLWGLDLAQGTLRERLVELPCVEYWVGLAEGCGVTVIVPETTALVRSPLLYGYDYRAEIRDVDGRCVSAALSLPMRDWPHVLGRLGKYVGGAAGAALGAAAGKLAGTE